MRARLVVSAMLTTIAGRLSAQDVLTLPGTDRETVTLVAQIVTSTGERGLPTDPVIGEARFAALNGVPGPRIVIAARSVAERLGIARDALAPQPTPSDIAAGAEALKYGVPAKTLERIRAARRDRPVAVHLGVLTQLVSSHVPTSVRPFSDRWDCRRPAC